MEPQRVSDAVKRFLLIEGVDNEKVIIDEPVAYARD